MVGAESCSPKREIQSCCVLTGVQVPVPCSMIHGGGQGTTRRAGFEPQMDSQLTLASGAKQLVVQEALDTTSSLDGSYVSSFTPITNMGASLEGAEMTTFLAPPPMCLEACQAVNAQSDCSKLCRVRCAAIHDGRSRPGCR